MPLWRPLYIALGNAREGCFQASSFCSGSSVGPRGQVEGMGEMLPAATVLSRRRVLQHDAGRTMARLGLQLEALTAVAVKESIS